jgi:hypothetical protein
MSPPAPEQQIWMIEPLIDAGLGLDEIRELVVRLVFETLVSVGPAALIDLVGDQPPEVQAAWWQAIGRMINGDGSAGRQ